MENGTVRVAARNIIVTDGKKVELNFVSFSFPKQFQTKI